MNTYEWVNPDNGEIVIRYGVPLRSPYNYDMDEASEVSGLDCSGEPSKTQQHFKEECDINTIVERFGLTGELPSDVKVPLEGDFTDVVNDYQSALNMVKAADEAFMKFPAAVRARFENNPQLLQEFVANKDNLEEARKLGIAVPAPVAPEPMQVHVVNPPATP